MNDNILLIGSGAREHAIAMAIDRSHTPSELFCMASNLNPGITSLCKELIVDDFNDPDIVVSYAKDHKIGLAIIGPENPLEKGVADALSNSNVNVIGPKKNLAQIETSKGFARELLNKHGIPGAPKFKIFSSMSGVGGFLDELGENYVIKFDGLAGGKGVKVSGDHLQSKDEALDHCLQLVKNDSEFVIEEKFIGQEFSLMSFSDGKTLKHMPTVQDHKRAFAGDIGPNTGGMGTYSNHDHSLPFLIDSDIEEAQYINETTAKALKIEFGEGYKGILYGGFMATAKGVKLIEYNARFGDPEAMNVLSILETDFVKICQAIATERLHTIEVTFKKQATVCKYAVPNGYPENPVKGKPIDVSGINDKNHLFYASVDIENGTLVEVGSRTVAVVGIADTIENAEKIAEKEISKIEGPLFHRKDIGTNTLVQKCIQQMEQIR